MLQGLPDPLPGVQKSDNKHTQASCDFYAIGMLITAVPMGSIHPIIEITGSLRFLGLYSTGDTL